MRLLLSQAQEQLAEYVDYGTCPTDPRVTQWINLAIERLLPQLNPEKTIGKYSFPILDSNVITMPRDVKTALGGYIQYPTQSAANPALCSCELNQLVQVRNRWYDILPGGPINYMGCAPNILTDLGTGWVTFDDITPDAPAYIRVYCDIPQAYSEGNVEINADDVDGNPVWSLEDGIYAQCYPIPIPMQGTNYNDSDIAFSKINSIKKPKTVTRVKLYAVDVTSGEQRPIAVYGPDEVAPDYRRYRINWCSGNQQPANLIAFCKRQFVWSTDPDADLLITNIGVLKNALQAMKYENAGSEQAAEIHWTRAAKILNEETRDYDGDYSATMQVQSACWAGGEIWNLH